MKTIIKKEGTILKDAAKSMLEWKLKNNEEALMEISDSKATLLIAITNSESGIATKAQGKELEALEKRENDLQTEREDLNTSVANFNNPKNENYKNSDSNKKGKVNGSAKDNQVTSVNEKELSESEARELLDEIEASRQREDEWERDIEPDL